MSPITNEPSGANAIGVKPSGFCAWSLKSNWPGPLPPSPQDSRYVPSGEMIQNRFSNGIPTQRLPSVGLIAMYVVEVLSVTGPCASHSIAIGSGDGSWAGAGVGSTVGFGVGLGVGSGATATAVAVDVIVDVPSLAGVGSPVDAQPVRSPASRRAAPAGSIETRIGRYLGA